MAEAGLQDEVEVFGTGCLGLCDAGPARAGRETEDGARLYREGDAGERRAHRARGRDQAARPAADLLGDRERAFFAKQRRIVLENSGRIDPERIESYVAEGGYEALQKAVTEMTPLEVIQEITASGLRGRGGGGYPTGLKWSTVYKAKGAQASTSSATRDEGDPGAFMDRSVLEGDPHRVLEGMAIAAYAVGAEQGYVYVRGEYPLAIQRLQTAIKQAERLQFLGGRILDTGFSFRVDIRIGAGRLRLRRGDGADRLHRGQARHAAAAAALPGHERPVGPAHADQQRRDLRQRRRRSCRNGGAWFASIGTEKSKGTKVFALAGKIENTGLIEVPMGITLREIIFDIGGGIPGGRAVQGRADRRAVRRLHPGRSTSTCRWTTSRWRGSARSWARAASS